jgi:electron-transferring-flavoprotein dehydrogenase
MADTLDYDVAIVGAGPAGLAGAVRLKQRAPGLSVAVLEKGGAVGAHLLSGAVLDTRALDDLLPGEAFPGGTPVTRDRFALLLSSRHAVPLPVPPPMHNPPSAQIVSLGALARWLSEKAEALGVDILPGFAGRDLVHDGDRVVGVATGEADIRARHTVLAEGARGSLTKGAIARFRLDEGRQPQTFALGIKEVWEVDPAQHRAGEVLHTIGWPLGMGVYGGGFVYHMAGGRVAVGLIMGLDYANTNLDPFAEMQRMKTHRALAPLFRGGRRLEWGARVLAEGGWQALPRLTFPGGCLVGDTAGTLDVPRLKGVHAAMESGMMAADAIAQGADYAALFRDSRLAREIWRGRNVRPGFRLGLVHGLLNAGFTWATGGREPWTLPHARDWASLSRAASRAVGYPPPDGVLTFDRASSVHLSGTWHTEGAPSHLVLADPSVPITRNLPTYGEPAQRYCPAGVFA